MPKKAEPKEETLCGHINKQFISKDGKREDLACTLPKGHEGDHFAIFPRVVTDYGVDKDGRPAVKGVHIEDTDGWWGDAAGESPSHTTTPEEDFKRLQETRNRERGVDEALSQKIDSEVKRTFGG
jgi:hypothetical protein